MARGDEHPADRRAGTRRERVGAAAQRLGALAALVEHAGDAIFSYGLDGVITTWNPGAERLYGYAPEEAIGQPVRTLAIDGGDDVDAILERVRAGETVAQYETVRRHRNGGRIDVSLTVAPIRDGRGAVTAAAAVGRDIRDRKALEDRLRGLAERDSLTGLFNRRRFEEELERHVAHAGRYGSTGAVLLIDLDNFKFVNDAYGHGVGDELLRATAGALRQTIRRSDAAARLGGDEFAVLLAEVDADSARAATGRLFAAMDEHRPAGLEGGASIGVALFGGQTSATPGDLLVAADVALGEAKQAGRGEVVLYTGQTRASLTWAGRLRTAIDDDRLVLHAQPIVDLTSGATAGHELLLRMLDDDGKPILPGAFLPTAERFDLLRDLDRWVVERALDLASAGHAVSVNLSPESVGDADFLALLERHADSRTGLDRILFEITETLTIARIDRARAFAQRLHQLGCRLALDDFGTGVGSFSYLKHLPVAYLKIDTGFVRDVARSEVDERVVRSIVSVAHAFEVRTIAEGVEDRETLDRLRACGVDYAQGYHLGRPTPTGETSW